MFSQPPLPLPDASGDERRREIIAATQALVAEKGIEGLRVRDVADRVGINNATLHYYFKTKEVLIEAVVRAIVHDLISTHDPQHPLPDAPTPKDELDAHVADILYQLRSTPARFIVLGELLMRAHHEPAVHEILLRTDQEWHHFLVDILRRGAALGQFNTDIDIAGSAHLIMMLLKGSTIQLNASPREIEQLFAQIRRWIVV